MMKKFILIVCGSFVGAFLAFMFFMVAAMIMSFAIMGSMGSMSSSKKAVSVTKHSILSLDLSTSITERDGAEAIDMLSILQGDGIPTSMGLNTMLNGIQKAADDKNIDGIFIKCNGVIGAPATLEALRHALKEFKKSGKWILAYGYEGINQADYYLASVADSIYLNPVGSVDIHGMAAVTPYMKKLLDKVGVEMQIIRVGTFKSAVEPYMLEDISDANRLQQQHYMGAIWNAMRDSIAVDRKMSSTALNALADSVIVTFEPERLVKEKLVDKLIYKEEMYDLLCKRTEKDKIEDLNFVTCADIADDQEHIATGEHIAVVYAVGEIDGSSSLSAGEEGIDSEELSSTIYDLKDDDKVKGMVLRVNSPGGSAFGSEQLWKAIEDFKAAGKPVAVSMGDYAASGGYYISCCADRIFAERTTITGSIGIFGMIPCVRDLVENKLGVHMASVKTNENADMGAMGLKLTPVQINALQNMVNQGYELFTKRCANGRHVTQDSIKSIAEGRVWDAVTAKQIGLVDEFGGIAEAVAWVAKKAKLDDYKTQNYPAIKDPFMSMLDKYMVTRYESRLQGEMGLMYEWHKQLQRILGRDQVLCLMPVEEIRF